MAISRIKGTQDFLDLRLYNFVIAQAKKHFERYHFSEIATPIIEPVELFHRSLGQTSDVVSKEMFVIKTHGQSKENICLRPELTAPTVRSFIEHHIQQTPWKVFSYGPVFRYERPQKGRYRQFHQLNIEAIGTDSIMQDAQCIAMLERFFHEQLTINNYTIDINFLGCASDRVAYKKKLYTFLQKHEDALCPTCRERKEKNIMRVFDCKNPHCQDIYQKAPYIADTLCNECQAEWNQLQHALEMLSISFVYRPTLVRGLDYYGKTVFEFSSNLLGAQSAFCGGGRYNTLVKELGAKQDQPAIGAAIGLERLLLLLEPYVDHLPLPMQSALQVIVPVADEQKMLALLLADELRGHGIAADVILDGGSIKSMMRKANKMGASYALVVGQEEQASRSVTVKNMVTGAEKCMAQTELISYLTA